MSSEYRIDKLSDFLKVPHDKQAECLRDFETWLDICRRSEELQSELKQAFPEIAAELNCDGFVWIDDGQAGLSDVSFSVNGEEVARSSDFEGGDQ